MAKSKSYASEINAAKLMAAGLKAQSARVAKRGISADFTSKLDALQNDARNLDNEQEALKAREKEKTAELKAKMKDLKKMMSEANKAVKLEMEKESWKEFGIGAKR
ncbi:MAG: hypothetical protein AABZ39_02720 [Spirochaetota bacterium]